MPEITPENMAIQARNYWQAAQWLANAGATTAQRDHAIALLKAQSACPELGRLADRAADMLDHHYINVVDLSLWQGMRP